MAKILGRFKRVAAVFDSEVARARLCESSGSEHSADQSLTDLSDLVNSFLEKEYKKEGGSDDVDREIGDENFESEKEGSVYEKDALKDLFGCQAYGIKRIIHEAVEKALLEVGNFSTPDFKRGLVARLRRRGFDAGLCKSKWEKTGNCPSGSYEYIDVFMSGNRYIVEVSLAKEFNIARPTDSYLALLEVFPPVFVVKLDELKQITKFMCKSMKKSMRGADIHVPPWRRLAYVQAKWFSSYKRTVNQFPAQKALNSDHEELKRKRSVGFAPIPTVLPFGCRAGLAANVSAKVGNLTSALNN